MDHIEVLREKIASLRDEIAQIKELNDQHRCQGNNPEAQIAHGPRLERLHQIQQELAQLAPVCCKKGIGSKKLENTQRIFARFSRDSPVRDSPVRLRSPPDEMQPKAVLFFSLFDREYMSAKATVPSAQSPAVRL